jgi:hypothetical protein
MWMQYNTKSVTNFNHDGMGMQAERLAAASVTALRT